MSWRRRRSKSSGSEGAAATGRVQNSIHIARPVAEVFAYVADPANSPKWNSTVLASSASETPVDVGTTIRSRVRFLGRTSDLDATVREFQPNTRFVTETLKPYRYLLIWTFSPENGGTRVVRAGDIDFRGPLKFLSPILIRPIARRTDQASLERMKALLEAPIRATAR